MIENQINYSPDWEYGTNSRQAIQDTVADMTKQALEINSENPLINAIIFLKWNPFKQSFHTDKLKEIKCITQNVNDILRKCWGGIVKYNYNSNSISLQCTPEALQAITNSLLLYIECVIDAKDEQKMIKEIRPR